MLFLVDLAGSEMVKKTHATGQVRDFDVVQGDLIVVVVGWGWWWGW